MATPNYTFKDLPVEVQDLYRGSPKAALLAIQTAFFSYPDGTAVRLDMEATTLSQMTATLTKAAKVSGMSHRLINIGIRRAVGLQDEKEVTWAAIPTNDEYGSARKFRTTPLGQLTLSDWRVEIDVSRTTSRLEALARNLMDDEDMVLTCAYVYENYALIQWLPMTMTPRTFAAVHISHVTTGKTLEDIFLRRELSGEVAAQLQRECALARDIILQLHEKQLVDVAGHHAGLPETDDDVGHDPEDDEGGEPW